VELKFDSRLLVSARSKTKIQSNGSEHVSSEMPVSVSAADDRAIDETPVLHSGARLAAKLKAKIILNDTEFNNVGEMSVDDRHLYHQALEAMFPASIAVAVSEPENQAQESVSDPGHRQRPRWSCLSLAARLLGLKR
jgi:hypothetical protein